MMQCRTAGLLLALAVFVVSSRDSAAQETVIITEDGTGEARTFQISPENLPQGIRVEQFISPSNSQAVPPGAQLVPGTEEEKKPEGVKKDGEKKPGDTKQKKEPDLPKIIKRPDKPETPPNPAELEIRPDENGQLRHFSFHGQPWPDVLRWLRDISRVSLDWQELPGGYLNLTTRQSYTVDEIRNLINRHLLSRGFTILLKGRMMTVEKIDKLNPALVPRVRPEDLDSLQDYEYVKVSFRLRSMLSDDAAVEFADMKSPNGKLMPLSNTNRLEAMDTALNLREIRDVLNEEQSNEGEKRLVRPFYLTYVRAEDIVDQLYKLLGEQPPVSGGGRPMNAQQMQQIQQQMQQMQQMLAQAQSGGKKGRVRKQEKVHIVPNKRENSILVNAPPDKMAIIIDAVDLIDQPRGGNSTLENVTETEVYRLTNLKPDSIVKTIEGMGGLSPRTTIQVDNTKRALIVSGPSSDHIIIEMLIARLDGSHRRFRVIPLRKHDAEYVAGSIRFMMGQKAEDESESRRRSFFFGFREDEERYDGDEFRVDADVEYNRLLLWSNDLEYASVEGLLMEIGEISRPGGNRNPRRLFRADSLEEAIELLNRVEKTWPTRRKNKLNIDHPEPPPKTNERPRIGPGPFDQLDPIDPIDPKTKPMPEARNSSDHKPELPLKGNQTAATAFEIFQARTSTPLLALNQQTVDEQNDFRPRPGQSRATNNEEPSQVPTTPVANPAPRPVDAEAVPRPQGVPDRSQRPDNAEIRRRLEELKKRFGPASRQPNRTAGDGSQPPSTAPIDIRVSPAGEIYFESQDTDALDRFEEVLETYAPPKRDWKIIQLKYPNTWPYGIELILHDVFKEELKAGEQQSGFRFDPFFGMVPSTSTSRGPARMSRRRPLKIISDADSHTILVQGASREQMQMIEELIAVYDRPLPTDQHAIRRTKVFKIKHSSARVIADAIKDVYRDLLSANDKALQQQNQEKDKNARPPTGGYTVIYGASETEGADGKKEKQPLKFKGHLSIGVDEVSNILIVSAGGGLLENISQIVEALDTAAKPNSAVEVVKVDSRVNTRLLQQRLHKIFGPKQQPKQQNQQGQKPGQPGQQPQNANGAAQRVNVQNFELNAAPQ